MSEMFAELLKLVSISNFKILVCVLSFALTKNDFKYESNNDLIDRFCGVQVFGEPSLSESLSESIRSFFLLLF